MTTLRRRSRAYSVVAPPPVPIEPAYVFLAGSSGYCVLVDARSGEPQEQIGTTLSQEIVDNLSVGGVWGRRFLASGENPQNGDERNRLHEIEPSDFSVASGYTLTQDLGSLRPQESAARPSMSLPCEGHDGALYWVELRYDEPSNHTWVLKRAEPGDLSAAADFITFSSPNSLYSFDGHEPYIDGGSTTVQAVWDAGDFFCARLYVEVYNLDANPDQDKRVECDVKFHKSGSLHSEVVNTVGQGPVTARMVTHRGLAQASAANVLVELKDDFTTVDIGWPPQDQFYFDVSIQSTASGDLSVGTFKFQDLSGGGQIITGARYNPQIQKVTYTQLRDFLGVGESFLVRGVVVDEP